MSRTWIYYQSEGNVADLHTDEIEVITKRKVKIFRKGGENGAGSLPHKWKLLYLVRYVGFFLGFTT